MRTNRYTINTDLFVPRIWNDSLRHYPSRRPRQPKHIFPSQVDLSCTRAEAQGKFQEGKIPEEIPGQTRELISPGLTWNFLLEFSLLQFPRTFGRVQLEEIKQCGSAGSAKEDSVL